MKSKNPETQAGKGAGSETMFTLWISQAGGRIDRVIIFNLIETIFALIWSCFALAFSCMPNNHTRCVSRMSKSMHPSWRGDGKHLDHYTKTDLCPSHIHVCYYYRHFTSTKSNFSYLPASCCISKSKYVTLKIKMWKKLVNNWQIKT